MLAVTVALLEQAVELLVIEAVNKVRQMHLPYPPSSPAIALFKDGQLVNFIERHQIEGRPAQVIAQHLISVFQEHCN